MSPREKEGNERYLKAIPQGESRLLRAGILAPPVSGIHHCLKQQSVS